MMKIDAIFDDCLIVFNEINVDARALNIAETLAKSGKRICIIAIADAEEEEVFSKKGILLHSIKKSTHNRMWRRWIDFIKEANSVKISAKRYWACDMYSLPVAINNKRHHNGKLFYDSREIFSALGPASRTPLKQKVITFLEHRWAAKVDDFIVSGELDAEFLKKHFKTDKPFHVIMNLPPFQKAVQSNRLREHFNIDFTKKIIVYQGVILEGRGLIATVQALKHFDDACLCIIGDGPFRENVEAEAIMQNVADRVFFTGQLPYNQLHEWTSSGDAGICWIEPISYSYELALPNKLFEYIMARIPVLASDMPAMKKIIAEEKTGIVLDRNSTPEEIAEALKKLCSNANMPTFIAQCNKSAIKYSYESQINAILLIIE